MERTTKDQTASPIPTSEPKISRQANQTSERLTMDSLGNPENQGHNTVKFDGPTDEYLEAFADVL
jgi:hypothetical protein